MSKSLNNLTSQKNSNFDTVRDGFEGFADLTKELEKYIKASENAQETLILGAKAFLNDLDKLAKPMSRIKKSGYTHLIDSFTYECTKNEVVVGWGKYYGRMVENGTEKMNAKPHFYPLWDKNAVKYYKLMIDNFKL